MMFTILMLLSHAITDFMLQTDESVRLKSEMKPAGYLYHGLVLFTVSAVMLFFMDTAALPDLLIRVVAIVLLHILIDVLKEYLQKAILGNEKRSGHKRNRDVLLLFVADQMVHILMIFLLTEGASAGMIGSQPFVLVAVKTLFIILYLTFSGAYLIPLLFNVVYSNVDDYGERLNERLKADMDKDTHVFIDEVKTGKWIGSDPGTVAYSGTSLRQSVHGHWFHHRHKVTRQVQDAGQQDIFRVLPAGDLVQRCLFHMRLLLVPADHLKHRTEGSEDENLRCDIIYV